MPLTTALTTQFRADETTLTVCAASRSTACAEGSARETTQLRKRHSSTRDEVSVLTTQLTRD